jgi:transcriptional regulator with XRE-family HTH domain
LALRAKMLLVSQHGGGVNLGYWADVAKIVNGRMAERGITQQELAERSGVSPATLRKIQAGDEQKRTRSTLANVSRALGFADDHLWRVSRGDRQPGDSRPDGDLSELRAEVASLARRMDALESRIGATADR